MATSTQIILIAVLFLLVCMSSFFSAAETAYSSVKPAMIESKIKQGKKSALLIKKHYKSFGWTLSTILIANNLVNIGASSLTTFLFTKLMSNDSLVTIVSTFAITPIIVIFGEIIPKILAKKYSYSYLTKIVYILEGLNWLFFPITFPLSKVTLQSKVTHTEIELKTLLRLARKERVLDRDEATIAQRALDLDSKIVRSVMTKKDEIVWIGYDATISQAKEIFNTSGRSRVLVKKDSSYVGIIILKDIAFSNPKEAIAPYIVPLIKVSKASLVTNALEKMRVNKAHIALVVQTKTSDAVVGIITIEDILEELVGEIYDEHDELEPIREVAHFKYIAYGSAPMKDLADELEFDFEDINDLTVKQWIQSRITRKIKKGLRYEYKDQIAFKVLKNKNNEETIIEVIKKLG